MSPGLKCAEIVDRLRPLIRGELSPEEETTVRSHLARCPACTQRHALFERVETYLAKGTCNEEAAERLRESLREMRGPSLYRLGMLARFGSFGSRPAVRRNMWIILAVIFCMLLFLVIGRMFSVR